MRKVWYLVAASYDAETGKLKLYQEPCVTPTNGGLGMSLLHPADETTAFVEATNNLKPRANDAPFLMAASTLVDRAGRHIQGGHYKEAINPVELPEQTLTYNGKIDRPRLSRKALSKAEIESLARGYSGCTSKLRTEVIGAWDFHANITKNIASTFIVDTTSNHLNGFIINLPCRGMTGYNWTADDIVYHHKPEEYGAIHFHDDDIDDARWEVDFTFDVPDLIKSGVYAARLRINGEDSPETEDFVPFVIKPPKGKTTSKLLFVLPSNSYMAYSNDNLGTNSVVAQLLAGKVPVLAASDLYLNEHREYGLSTYSLHSDGSGVCYSSRLRPILNMRPKYRHWLSPSLWQLNGDLHLTDWLEEKNLDFDVVTDEDLHIEGVDLLIKVDEFPVLSRIKLLGNSKIKSKKILNKLDLINGDLKESKVYDSDLGDFVKTIEEIKYVISSEENERNIKSNSKFKEIVMSSALPTDTICIGDLDNSTQKKINNFQHGGSSHEIFEPYDHAWENERHKE